MDAQLVRRMTDVLAHRGPDEHGCYVSGNLGLGHRRLSIIDLTTGQQPMRNERGDLRIVFNGEIYNFPQLRSALETRGCRFRTQSDTEVILHLYDEYGPACVTQLRGMFAFAIWDQRRQRLVLARDRLGQKPLFYALTPDALLFASEIKALLQDASLPRRLNLPALSQYLTYQYVPPPDTMFQGISKLPPAHTLVCERGHVTLNPYWELRYTPKPRRGERETLAEFDALFREAVRMRMISDVPIGAFLSGGLDSSLVLALMAQFSSRPVNTFSIGFEEAAFNELPYARLVADRYQTEHREFIVKADALEVLPKLIWHFDEPFGDPSAIPTYYLAQMTGRHVKVALNGDGGDESFAGYQRYLGQAFVRRYRKLPHPLRKAVLRPLINGLHSQARLQRMFPNTLRRMKYFNDLSLLPPERLYARYLTIFDDEAKHGLLSDAAARQLVDGDSLKQILACFAHPNAEHFTDKMLYADVMTYLPGDLLVKIDRMTMAHGLEGRSPFLDHKLMEFAAALPAQQKLRGACLKCLLKRYSAAWLPAALISRKKQGFGVPLNAWFRRELRDMLHDALTSSALAHDGILRDAALQRVVRDHQRGLGNHGHQLWVLLNLELWYRMFFSHD